MELIWSTYFGGNNSERGMGLSYSPADQRLYFCGRTTTNNSLLSPGDNFLPNFDFDINNPNDYWQEEPFQDTDLPAWAAFFDVNLLDDPNLSTDNAVNIEDHFIIYPNPSSDLIFIKSDYFIEEVNITNLSGQVVYSSYFSDRKASISLEQLSTGMYLINVKTQTGIQTKKFIKE